MEVLFNESAERTRAVRDNITYLATGVAIFRADRLLVVRRVPHDSLGGHYEIPGGGVDDGETIPHGAVREAREETGLRVARLVCQFAGLDYVTRSHRKVRQFNFVAEAEPGDVQLDPAEHDDYLWITPRDIADVHSTPEMQHCFQDAFDAANAPKNQACAV